MLLFFAALESLEPEEREEIGRIYEKTYKMVPSLLSKFMNISYGQKPELIDDLTQDVYLKVIRYKDKFIGQPERIVKGNLTKIAKSICIDYWRHNGVIQFSSLEDTDENDDGRLKQVDISEGADILSDLIREEIIERLSTIIDNMGAPIRELLIDRFYYEMPYKEIAEKYEVKIGSISTLISRNLEKLRKELEEYVENYNE